MTPSTGDRSERAKYMQVMDAIRDAILSGEFPAHRRLPGRRRLAAESGVAPGTVTRALHEYVRMGVLTIHAADGAFVTPEARGILSNNGEYSPAVERLTAAVGMLVDRVEVLERDLASLRSQPRFGGTAQIPDPR